MSGLTPEPWLQLRGVQKSFPRHRKDPPQPVLRGLDLEIAKGECLVLLGASGSGKTTTLRLLAGFEQPDAGSIHCEGRLWDKTMPPEKRGVAMVFQEAALYPHLNVRGNLEFGLGKITGKTAEVLNEVIAHTGIGTWMDKRPDQLSGGEKQRVSLARALSRDRPLLLCDEPLSQLDMASRTELRRMLRDWQQRRRLTLVYVTHDQTEAMALADRLAILSDGRVLECAASQELYLNPQHLATAQLLGSPSINIFTSKPHMCSLNMENESRLSPGRTSCFRAEDLRVAAPGEGMLVTVIQREFGGHETVYTLKTVSPEGVELRWRSAEHSYAVGDSLRIAIIPGKSLEFASDTGLRC